MTPRPTDLRGDDAHDLVGVTATDQLLDRLGRGEDVPAGQAADVVVDSLSVLAAEARTPVTTRPSLDDLLQAAGLEPRPAGADHPGGLEVVGQPGAAVLDGRPDTGPEGEAPRPVARILASPARLSPARLSRTPAAQRVAYVVELAGDRTGRGLRRVGVDTDNLRRVSPMLAAAAAVVAFGLTGVATGVFSADPTGHGVRSAGPGAEAHEVSELLDKARTARALGRTDEAAAYYLRASRLVNRLNSGPGREHLSRQVEELRVQLGLPVAVTEPADGLSPSDPVATTDVSPGETAVPDPTPDGTPGSSGSPTDPSASDSPSPSTSTAPASPQPTSAPETSTPPPSQAPTPSSTSGAEANGGSGLSDGTRSDGNKGTGGE